MVPHVHRGPAIVARLIATDVTEKGLKAMEGSSAVPATLQLGTHVVEGQRVDPLNGWRADGVPFEASRAKKTAMTMAALLRGSVKIIGQSVGPQVDLQIIVVVPRARLLSDGLSQGANHFLPGVSQTGLSSQTSPERLPGDAE